MKRCAETYTRTPGGGSHTHSPVVRLAYMCSFVFGSMISTHSILDEKQRANESLARSPISLQARRESGK